MKRPNFSRAWKIATAVGATVVAIVTGLAAAPDAWNNAQDALSEEEAVRKRPPESVRVTDRFIAEVRKTMAWDRPPEVQRPSVQYMKSHFAQMDPRQIHRIGEGPQPTQVTIGELVPRLPSYAGTALLVGGELRGRQQVTEYSRADSWAFFLVDRAAEGVAVVCRVPLRSPYRLRPLARAGRAREFEDGDQVVAQGVVVADGSAPIRPGGPSRRVLYMACSSVGHVGFPSATQ